MLLEKLIEKKFNEINILKRKLISRSEDKKEIINRLRDLIDDIDIIIFEGVNLRNKGFTEKELAKYNGVGNNLAYVALEGTVYDLTGINLYNSSCKINFGTDITKEYYDCDNYIKEKIKSGRIVGYLLE